MSKDIFVPHPQLKRFLRPSYVLNVGNAWDKEQTSELLEFAQSRYPPAMILGSHHVAGHEISVAEAVELFLNCGLDQRAHAAKVVLSIFNTSLKPIWRTMHL